MAFPWCLIESDPGVFTELIETFGVSGLQVDELYSLEALDDHSKVAPIRGLIFLFNAQGAAYEDDERLPVQRDDEPGLFFASQLIPNACATQAILSVLLNLEDADHEIDLGSTLREFKHCTSRFSPDLKGLAISNSAPIRDAHNRFAAAEPFVLEQESRHDDASHDAFHFIAYVPFNGKVYELDGLKAGPILLGDVDATRTRRKRQREQPLGQGGEGGGGGGGGGRDDLDRTAASSSSSSSSSGNVADEDADEDADCDEIVEGDDDEVIKGKGGDDKDADESSGGSSWLEVARPAIEARFEKYRRHNDNAEIRFNLMGIVKNRGGLLAAQEQVLRRRLAVLAQERLPKKRKFCGTAEETESEPCLVADAVASSSSSSSISSNGVSDGNGDCHAKDGWIMAGDAAGQAAQLSDTNEALRACEQAQREEEEKIAAWKMENLRRKHNYMPFVVNLLRMLAEKKQLKALVDKANSGGGT